MKFVCELCGYIYDEAKGEPKRGFASGTVFAGLPGDYECPCCGCGKEAFDPVGEDAPVKKGEMPKNHSQR